MSDLVRDREAAQPPSVRLKVIQVALIQNNQTLVGVEQPQHDPTIGIWDVVPKQPQSDSIR